ARRLPRPVRPFALSVPCYRSFQDRCARLPLKPPLVLFDVFQRILMRQLCISHATVQSAQRSHTVNFSVSRPKTRDSGCNHLPQPSTDQRAWDHACTASTRDEFLPNVVRNSSARASFQTTPIIPG